MSQKNIRMIIEQIKLDYDGDEFVDEGTAGRAPYSDKKKFDNILEASLEYPRSGAALVTTAKMMDLPSRTLVTPNVNDFWESGLFKEDVDTEARFKVRISDKDSVSKVGNWFRKIFSAIFNTAIGGKVKGITNLFQGAVASDLQSSLVASLKGDQKNERVAALCTSKDINIELDGDELSAFYMVDGERVDVLDGNRLILELFAAKNMTRVVSRVEVAGSKIKRKETETVFSRNEKIGEMKILLQVR